MAKTTLEAVHPAANKGRIGDESTFVLLVGDNLSKFGTNVLGFLGLASKAGESLGGIFNPALLDEVTRRVGKEHETTTENQSPGELDGNGDAVGASVIAFLCAVDDTGS